MCVCVCAHTRENSIQTRIEGCEANGLSNKTISQLSAYILGSSWIEAMNE